MQLFRAHLILHEQFALIFKRSLTEARKSKLLTGTVIRAALDTKPILGRGATEDTYNLLATGMLGLARAIAASQKQRLPAFLARHDLQSLNAPSIKGTADIDWSDEAAREAFLSTLVAGARKLISLADGSVPQVKEAGELLEKLMLQDIVEHQHPDGPPAAAIKRGTAKGRIPSATDPDQRHGRKSATKRFNGAKASVAVDVESGLVLAVEILCGDSGDATGALELVQEAKANTDCEIAQVLADCAYGGGATREEFDEATIELIAKVPASPSGGQFPKSRFTIELPVEGSLEMAKVTCPGGAVADLVTAHADGGATHYFDNHCGECTLRPLCTTSQIGRSIQLTRYERLIQKARKLQESADGRALLRQRLAVENALARLGNLGIGQARYIGHIKTKYQLSMAATVANLRRVWNWQMA